MEYYRQCTLKSGNVETVAWIEEYGAKVGCSVTLKDAEDPEQVWEVTQASTTRIPKTEALEKAREAVEFKKRGSIANQ
jgi:hypothetical protein